MKIWIFGISMQSKSICFSVNCCLQNLILEAMLSFWFNSISRINCAPSCYIKCERIDVMFIHKLKDRKKHDSFQSIIFCCWLLNVIVLLGISLNLGFQFLCWVLLQVMNISNHLLSPNQKWLWPSELTTMSSSY